MILSHKSPNRSCGFEAQTGKPEDTGFEVKPGITIIIGFEVKPEKIISVVLRPNH
jgi:hypothetical protein